MKEESKVITEEEKSNTKIKIVNTAGHDVISAKKLLSIQGGFLPHRQKNERIIALKSTFLRMVFATDSLDK